MLVDAGILQPFGYSWTEKKMIQPKTGVASIGVPDVVPKRVDMLFRIEVAQGISPTLFNEFAIRITHHWEISVPAGTGHPAMLP
jgi:hypothetical protein